MNDAPPAIMVYPGERGQPDMLFFGGGRSTRQQALRDWAFGTEGLHEFFADYHRLQLERWIWEQREALYGKRVMDVGLSIGERRAYLGPSYFTIGLNEGDVLTDLTSLAIAPDSLDAIVCTEVLEHCADPFAACQEMYAVLKPGGLLLVTAPFLWPYHGAPEYPDYWRFTHQGWKLLLEPFVDVRITACEWTDEGRELYHLLRRFECWGFDELTMGHTGYLCSGRKRSDGDS